MFSTRSTICSQLERKVSTLSPPSPQRVELEHISHPAYSARACTCTHDDDVKFSYPVVYHFFMFDYKSTRKYFTRLSPHTTLRCRRRRQLTVVYFSRLLLVNGFTMATECGGGLVSMSTYFLGGFSHRG